MPDLRLRLRSDRSAQCPYCHEEVEHRERNRRCAGCDAIQHAECWTEAEACAACGRAERPLPLLVRLSGALAWDRRAQFALRLVLAAAFGHYIWHRTDDLWGAIGAGAVAVAFLEWARLGRLEWTKAVVVARATEQAPHEEARWLAEAQRSSVRGLERKLAEERGEQPRRPRLLRRGTARRTAPRRSRSRLARGDV